MSKLDILTVVIVAVGLAALGYLVYKIVNLMNPPEPENPTAIQDAYALDQPDDETYTWEDEQDAAQDSLTYEEEPAEVPASTAAADEEEIDRSDAPVAETSRPATQNAPATDYSNVATTTSSGRYLVIAGSYRQRANADQMVTRLKGMGYNSAKVELFDRGTYAVVVVNRFNSLAQAKQLSSELSGKGVETFVKDNG
jgi:cell division protein FtsN